MSDTTKFLREVGNGDARAAGELLPLVYEELRKLARSRMAAERSSHTLQATALVHEAYLRLMGNVDAGWENRAHFFAAAAEAMRRILIEHARSTGRVKRGGGAKRPLPRDVLQMASEADASEIMALEEAICRLEKEDPEAGKVLRLRFYAGLSIDETAEVMGISARTVKRDWTFARAYLARTLGDT